MNPSLTLIVAATAAVSKRLLRGSGDTIRVVVVLLLVDTTKALTIHVVLAVVLVVVDDGKVERKRSRIHCDRQMTVQTPCVELSQARLFLPITQASPRLQLLAISLSLIIVTIGNGR
jgi:hypothetical protein